MRIANQLNQTVFQKALIIALIWDNSSRNISEKEDPFHPEIVSKQPTELEGSYTSTAVDGADKYHMIK